LPRTAAAATTTPSTTARPTTNSTENLRTTTTATFKPATTTNASDYDYYDDYYYNGDNSVNPAKAQQSVDADSYEWDSPLTLLEHGIQLFL